MRQLIILACLIIAHAQLKAQPNLTKFVLSVDSRPINEITISKMNYEAGESEKLRSIKKLTPDHPVVSRDRFNDPAIYTISTNDGQSIRIAVERPGTISLKLGDVIILESDVAKKSDFMAVIGKLEMEFFGELKAEYQKAMRANDQQTLARLEGKKEGIMRKFSAAMENTVIEMGASALAYDALTYFDVHKNYAFLQKMNAAFAQKYPGSSMSRKLGERMQRAEQVAMGGRAPIFQSKVVEGGNLDLSALRGQYVLIDFWASWCLACRVENPKLVSQLNTFKDKGFSLVSISIDENPEALRKAIAKDQLSGYNILDSSKSIYHLYQLTSLPSNFLLDKKGKIIAKNISADQLQVKLSSLLQ